MSQEEIKAADAAGFRCISSRVLVKEGGLVVARYSALPNYKELADDVTNLGAKLINSWRQHCYIADMRNWVEDLKELTPQTWYRPEDVPSDAKGPFVLKGEMNSKKEAWSTCMYAKDRPAIYDVYARLQEDAFIGAQDIYVRQYVPLVTYALGIGGLPITKEFRFFFCRRQLLTGAYYWYSWADSCLDVDPNWKEPCVDEVPQAFLAEVIARIGNRAEFIVIDAAQDITGRWWVVDVNDGQQSGLSGNKPDVLYSRLFEVLA